MALLLCLTILAERRWVRLVVGRLVPMLGQADHDRPARDLTTASCRQPRGCPVALLLCLWPPVGCRTRSTLGQMLLRIDLLPRELPPPSLSALQDNCAILQGLCQPLDLDVHGDVVLERLEPLVHISLHALQADEIVAQRTERLGIVLHLAVFTHFTR